jgi:hypothetical protein
MVVHMVWLFQAENDRLGRGGGPTVGAGSAKGHDPLKLAPDPSHYVGRQPSPAYDIEKGKFAEIFRNLFRFHE